MNGRSLDLPAVLLLTMIAAPSPAQVSSGAMTGRVTDTAGAFVPGVTVTVSGPSLLRPASALTTSRGAFRFADLPAGTYRARFERAGFAALVVEAIVVNAGSTARVDVSLARGGARESVVVAPHRPGGDPESAAVGATVTRDEIDRLPMARDVWSAVRSIAGVTTFDGAAPGASLHSAAASARGSDVHAISLDGVRLDGIEATGTEPWPFSWNLDAIEQVHVQTAGADASLQGGYVGLSVISRSTSNRFRGSARFGATGPHLQSSNLTPALRAQGAVAVDASERVVDIGAEAGAPVGGTRAWIWAALSRVDATVAPGGQAAPACETLPGETASTEVRDMSCAAADATTTTSASAKAQYQWAAAHASTVYWGWTRRVRPSVHVVPGLGPGATNRQEDLGHARPIRLEHRWAVSDRFNLDVKYAFSDGSFVLDFQDAALAGVQPLFNRTTGQTWRSTSRQVNRRSSSQLTAAGTVFTAGPFGGDHSVRFGLEALASPWEQIDQTGGGAVAWVSGASGTERPDRARIVRDGHLSIAQSRWSLWLQDSFRRGRFTINAGLRFDRQDDAARPTFTPANPILPDLLPAVRFTGADSGVTFDNVAPRVGAAWDAAGDGRTVVKVSAARYWGAGVFTAQRLQPTGPSWLALSWNDANGDLVVQRPELDVASPLGHSSNYVTTSPSSVMTLATVDPSLENDVADEVTAALERQVTSRFGLGVTWVFRRYRQLQGTYRVNPDGSPVSSESYAPVAWAPAPATCPAGAACPPVTYYERDLPLPPGSVLRNDGRHRWHHSVDVTARRRLAGGWMVALALTWQVSRTRFPVPTRDYTDPTNIPQQDGREYGTENARWLGRLSASRTLPGGLTASGIFSLRQGYPYVRTVRSPERGALGSTDVMIAPYAAERHAGVYQLDASIQRAFTVGRAAIAPVVNVFNVLNAGTVLGRWDVQNSPLANRVTTIVDPRRIRLDVLVRW
jgi:hypothetical protein